MAQNKSPRKFINQTQVPGFPRKRSCTSTASEVVWTLLLTVKQMGMMNLIGSISNFVQNSSNYTSHFFKNPKGLSIKRIQNLRDKNSN
jgi:hypothetical protein